MPRFEPRQKALPALVSIRFAEFLPNDAAQCLFQRFLGPPDVLS
jgi:hypothetical protein